MWIFTVISEFIVHLIFAVGVILTLLGFVLGFIPFINRYKIPIQIIGLLTLIFGTYLEGGLADNKEWELKVKEVEAQVAQAEAKASEKNVEIQEKIITKTKVVKEKGDEVIKYIDREVIKKEEVIKYVENCPVPKEIIDAHNAATVLNKATEGNKK